MRRSKMEMYISTLEALAYCGPLKITRITYKAKMNCSQLKAILDDLIQNKLVEERPLRKNQIFYAATPKARTVLSYFAEIKELLPTAEDDLLKF
jgi:predicted transcriptional regulator